MLSLRELESGRSARVCALAIDGRCQVIDFLLGLPERAQQRIVATMAAVADDGWRFRNRTRFKHLRNDIYEIKDISSNVRLFCFMHGGRLVVCTHGESKPSSTKAYNRAIKKVQRLYKLCIDEGVV